MEVIALEYPTNSTVRNDPGQDDPRTAEAAPSVYNGFSPVNTDDDRPLLHKHSGLGIASFTIFVSMALIFAISLGSMAMNLTGLIDVESGQYDYEDLERQIADMPGLVLMSIALLGTLLGNFVGLILGIVGLVQKERKKVFAILGTVLNGVVILGLALLVLVSVAALSAL